MQAHAQEVLAFVRQHGSTYPKDVQARFDHGRMKRWGANLNVSNHLLEGLHYRGLLRVARREGDRKSTRLNSSHSQISYAVFCLKKKKNELKQILAIVNRMRSCGVDNDR